jgi:hypothetical protein
MKPIIGVLVILAFACGCLEDTPDASEPQPQTYQAISAEGYDESLCAGIGYGQEGGIRGGVRIMPVDRESGASLPGEGWLKAGSSASSIGSGGSYTCYEGLASNRSQITIRSPGHAPASFDFQLSENKLATIRVFLDRSCRASSECPGGEETFREYVEKSFGLNASDYALDCMECELGRGGYIKARGTYKNSTAFDLYYRWGFCSSGGSDCGWTKCFNSDAETGFYADEKTRICASISSTESSDGYACNGAAYDNTTAVREQCLKGAFEHESGGRKTISIEQATGRCRSAPAKGLTDCLEY